MAILPSMDHESGRELSWEQTIDDKTADHYVISGEHTAPTGDVR